MFNLKNLVSVAVLASGVFAAPQYTAHGSSPTSSAYTPVPTVPPVIGALGVEIHKSCNVTERRQLEAALKDTEELVSVARDYVLDNGSDDPLFKKYFGAGSTAEVIGWFDKLLYGDKSGVLLRCDDIDGNCHQAGWAGHWRGENATEETVICEMSYRVRRPLTQMCALGYQVATSPTNVFFASDLVHRFFHVPKISELAIDHFTHGKYHEALEFAETNATHVVRNTDNLQWFALDAYGLMVGNPGVGCAGEAPEHAHESASSSAAVSASVASPTVSATQVASSVATPTVTATQAATSTTEAPKACHTHSDGAVHCE
ncbi:uncharacterized protein H6S33_009301 [Morchella sextelata]|uniref:uncharacterized protein n=1 Tax=Morchella sextelata TaxID=1174677 RepID=UPI001D03A622|nr:uncharacterized protein H6S33_009301 [Morchella sextelata]KAH0612921.1 hypothetical protein H6S33_009301 [Morchella sextelata]